MTDMVLTACILIFALVICASPARAGSVDSAERMTALALKCIKRKHYREAEAWFLSALRKINPQQEPSLGLVESKLNQVAAASFETGNLRLAANCFECALDTDAQLIPPDKAATAADLNGLAAVYVDERKFEKAEPLFQRLFQLHDEDPHLMTEEQFETVKENYGKLLQATKRSPKPNAKKPARPD